MRKILTLLLALAAPLAGAQTGLNPDAPDAPGAQALGAADAVIVQMRAAFRKSDRAQLAALLPLAAGHALEPWADYWELKARLPLAQPAEVDAFLQRHAGTYQEDRLRNDWLLLLGQRRDWGRFLAYEPPYRMRDDAQVRCYALGLAHLTHPETAAGAGEEAARLWLAQKDADDGCLWAVSRLLDDGQVPPSAVWRKARAALLAGKTPLARAAVALLHPEALPHIEAIAASPARWLAAQPAAVADAALRRELTTLALARLASADPAQASAWMPQWAGQMSEEGRDWVWAAAGHKAALRLSADAPAYFSHVRQPAWLLPEAREWMARAALRAGQWPEVLRAISAMPAAQASQPVWVYWKARALAATGQAAQAQPLYQSIARASGGGFYEKLAAERLGLRLQRAPAAPPVPAAMQQAVRHNAGLNRALLAILLGLRSEGVREWNYTVNLHTPGGMSDGQRHAAAAYACQHEVWDRCISASERLPFSDEALRFPTPHRAEVLSHASASGLEAAYVYGLIRQESRFVTAARSRAGASGLMQIMPATARWTARQLGLKGFKPAQINELDTNLQIGSHYLKLALERFDGALPLAAAAYNAGPNRARQWRAPDDGAGPELEGAAWVENIPFDETRTYVKNVLSNTVDYAALLTGQPQSLAQRLGRIAPPAPQEEAGAELP